MTLEKLLRNLPDVELHAMYEEAATGIIPTFGSIHTFRRRINRMTNDGKLCINPNTYRRIYVPTLARAIKAEMARRYCMVLKGQLEHSETIEQLVLDVYYTYCKEDVK